MRTFCALVALIFLFLPTVLEAQIPLELAGQIRYRGQRDGRDFNRDTNASTENLLRTRVGLSVRPDRNTMVFVQIQDSRFFGEENETTDGSAKRIDLHQGYLRLTDLFELPVDLKLGRMELAYGNERLLGLDDWDNVGRSVDGITVRLKRDRSWFDLFAFQEKERFQVQDEGDRGVYGGWLYVPFKRDLIAQGFLIWQRQIPSSRLDQFTVGTHIEAVLGPLRPRAEGVYQFGTSAGLDVSAYMIAGGLSVEPANAGPVSSLTAGIDYLSGNCGCGPNERKAFDTLYGSGNKFYGAMDVFHSLPNDALGLGLMDIYGALRLALGNRSSLDVSLHHLRANDEYVFPGEPEAFVFGTELDVQAILRYSDYVTFSAGGSLFDPGAIFSSLRGEDPATWFYFSTTIDF